MTQFIDDLQNFGFAVAWFNLRFNLAWAIAKFLIQQPVRLEVKDDSADPA